MLYIDESKLPKCNQKNYYRSSYTAISTFCQFLKIEDFEISNHIGCIRLYTTVLLTCARDLGGWGES